MNESGLIDLVSNQTGASEEPVENISWSRAIQENIWSAPEQDTGYNLPWNTAYYRNFFSDNRPTWPDVPLPAVLVPESMAREASAVAKDNTVRPAKKPKFSHAWRQVRNAKEWIVSEDALRQRALLKWRLLIETDLNSSEVGLQLIALCDRLGTDQEINCILKDVFAGKSTSTLAKRANAMICYLAWCKKDNKPTFCFVESLIYEYINFLRSSNVAPTKAESFRTSLTFCHYVLGLNDALKSAGSARVKGACRAMFVKKRPLRQAAKLLVTEVLMLEHACESAPNLQDCVGAGHFLFCLYASSRFGDSQKLSTLSLNVDLNGDGFVESTTLRHKTAVTKEKQTTFLPMVALAKGLRKHSWAVNWFAARKHAGLSNDNASHILPAASTNGLWLDRPLTSAEATAWLRDILMAYGTTSARASELSSHSLKTTVLAWSAQYGLPLDVRRLLGHHVDPQHGSTLTYSRDALVHPMQLVDGMLDEIRRGLFNPDLSRTDQLIAAQEKRQQAKSQRVPKPLLDVAQPEADFEAMTPQQSSPSSRHSSVSPTRLTSSSSSSGSSSLSSELDVEAEETQLVSLSLEHEAKRPVQSDDCYRNKLTGWVHKLDASKELRFVCSRPISTAYVRIGADTIADWPVCKQCYPAKKHV